jgi:hypothetical protein
LIEMTTMTERVLEDRTDEANLVWKQGEAAEYGYGLDWGVIFQTAEGRDACREMGKDHGFSDLAGARAWVKSVTRRADPIITAFYVFAWSK